MFAPKPAQGRRLVGGEDNDGIGAAVRPRQWHPGGLGDPAHSGDDFLVLGFGQTRRGGTDGPVEPADLSPYRRLGQRVDEAPNLLFSFPHAFDDDFRIVRRILGRNLGSCGDRPRQSESHGQGEAAKMKAHRNLS